VGVAQGAAPDLEPLTPASWFGYRPPAGRADLSTGWAAHETGTFGAMGAKKRWSDLTPVEQRTVIAGGVLELVVTGWALRDLARRPAGSIRGQKALWVASFVVQPFGPLAYAAFGRR
jgi:hypothetical protein